METTEATPNPSTATVASTAPEAPTSPEAPIPPKLKFLLITSLILKLVLLVLIFITIGVAVKGILSGDGPKQYDEYRYDKKKYEARNGKLTWSQEEPASTEYLAITAMFIPLAICIASCVIQCAVIFGSQRNSNASKVFSFGDNFLCFIGFIFLLCAASVLLNAVGKHCDDKETMDVTVPVEPDEGELWERWGHIKQPHRNVRSGGVDNDFDYHVKDEDKLVVTVKDTFENTRIIRMRYKKKCTDRWNSGTKIAAGVIGIIASLLFAAASVLSLLEGLGIGQGSTEPQNASEFQQGAYQPNGEVHGPQAQPQAPPGYAPAYPPPPYQPGYPPQVGAPLPQPTPTYIAANPALYQQQVYQPQLPLNPAYVPVQPPLYLQQGYQSPAPGKGQPPQ